jgi:hypothetical protein
MKASTKLRNYAEFWARAVYLIVARKLGRR